MATNHFNRLLNSLLSVDNYERHQAEDAYYNLTPDFKVIHLLNAIQNDQQPEQNRVMAAVLLRRFFVCEFQLFFKQLTQQQQGQLLHEILLAVQQCVSRNLLHKICEVAAEAARNLVDNHGTNHWPDFLQFFFKCANSTTAQLQEAALCLLTNAPLIFGNQEAEYMDLIKQILARSMESTAEFQVRSQAVHALGAFVLSHDRKVETVVKQFGDLLPRMLIVIAESLNAEEDQSLLQLLIDMTELCPKYLRPQLEDIFEMSMKAFSTHGIEDSWRQLGLEVMVSFSENDTYVVRKRAEQYIITLLPLLLQMMTAIDDDPNWATSDTIEGDDNADNSVIAETSLDRLSCALGGEAIVPYIMQFLPVMLNQTEWTQRHAALMAISAIAEGCHRQMEDNLDQIVARILIFLQDTHPRVRYAACNAIGQMATDFAPLFEKKYHGEIIPNLLVLFDDEQNPRVQAHASAALVKISEYCPKSILIQYLDRIMAKVESVLNVKLANKLVLENIVTLIASVADTCEKEFLPYYDRIMPYIKFIIQNTNSEDLRILRGKTFDCFSLIGLAVGRSKFMNDAIEIMNMIFKTHCEGEFNDDDPQTSYIIVAWARMYKILGKQFEQFLPQIIRPVLKAAAINPEIALLDNYEMGDVEGDVDGMCVKLSQLRNFAMRTARLEDKVSACQMLSFYARELKEGFADYTEEVVRMLVPMLAFYCHDSVRIAAAESLPALLDCVKAKGSQYLENMWLYMCPMLLKAISIEPVENVQAELLTSLAQCIETLGFNCVNNEAMNLILEIIDKYMVKHFQRTNKRASASKEDDYDDGIVQEPTELEDGNDYLLSKVVDVLHALFVTEKELFVPQFDHIAQNFIKLLDPARSAMDKQWGLCVFNDLIEYCGPACAHYMEVITPAFLQYLNDYCLEVRHTAINGCGLMGNFGGERFAGACVQIIPLLIQIVCDPSSREPEYINTTESSIAAVAKILKYNNSALQNIDEIIRVWFAWLPVGEDKYEAYHTYGYLCDLIEENNPIILGASNSNFPRILSIIADAFANRVVVANGAVGARMLRILKLIESDPEIFQACVSQLTPEMQRSLQEANHELALFSA